MNYILVIFWIINGAPVILDGWHPMIVEDRQTCEERRAFAYDYLQENYEGPYDYQIECIEVR